MPIGDDDDIPMVGMRGLVPRDYSISPLKMAAVEFPVIPMQEWPDRIADMVRVKSRVSDIRRAAGIPSLDQNGQGYCWAYSTTAAVQLRRAIANQPTIPLSAHSVACKIKNFRDEGAWGALSLDFITKNGVVPQSLWPAKSMSRQYDTPEAWAAAKEFMAGEQWADLAADVWDRTLTRQQIGTQLLLRNPGAFDYNWWGHSVCGMDLVDVYPNKAATDFSRYGVRILNSWSDNWGDRGEEVLKDGKAWPDGCTIVLTVTGG